jgi:ribosomal protein S18 acetylase RimI-like enzyme
MIELREFGRSDIPEMVAIQQAITKKTVSRTWTRMVERHLEDSHGVGVVAVRDETVLGFAIGEAKGEGFGLPQSGWIEVVGVDPQAMGQGIGKAMIDKLLEYFRRRKITNVYTAVRWDAVDMLSFFKSVGFGRSDFINLIRKL